MPRPFGTRHVIKILETQGFVFYSQKGSHAKYRRQANGRVITVIVPIHSKEIPYGTFRSILRQSHLEEEDFEK